MQVALKSWVSLIALSIHVLVNEYSFEIVGRMLKKIVKYPLSSYISNFIAAISSGSLKSNQVFPSKNNKGAKFRE